MSILLRELGIEAIDRGVIRVRDRVGRALFDVEEPEGIRRNDYIADDEIGVEAPRQKSVQYRNDAREEVFRICHVKIMGIAMDKVKLSDLNRDAIKSYASQRSDTLMSEIHKQHRDLVSSLHRIYKDDALCSRLADDAVDWSWRSGSPYYPKEVERLKSAPGDVGRLKGTYFGIVPRGALEARGIMASDQMRRLVDLGRCLNTYREIADRADKIGHVPAAERDQELEQLRAGLETADVAVRSRGIEDRDSRAELRKHPVMEQSRDPEVQAWLRSEPDR
ncbi:hypothetical protein ABLE93_25455 [Xanthobacter sp. KR7-65]|uniref:hypothetical protein n=1 Tax=Xanthobacter sp. KR7-65 TaxID=3156612 RepID=UPI0032B588BF